MIDFVNRYYPARLTVFLLVLLLFAVNSLGLLLTGHGWLSWLFWAVLLAVGVFDLRQSHHAILRNYPIIGHLRFLLEYIRPEIRQYFIESETESAPFSRAQRSLVYARAKGQSDKRPFGTQIDLQSSRYEWLTHSMNPSDIASADFRVRIGTVHCSQPYDISLFNVSAMSFGALSANAVLALNKGAKLGGFAHDTGEGSISRHHRTHGGDLIWEIGSGYFGCRNDDGTFSEERFQAQAVDPQVKMVEVKLSQGAKPGHGGVLLGPKVTEEIAEARGVPVGVDCVSPSAHSSFDSPEGLLHFVQRLRELSGGKPTGFKFCVGHPWEWFAVAKAMQTTKIIPDFIVVDGAEGGTGAAPLEFSDHMGMPMVEGLRLVHNTLVGLNLRDQIKLGVSGKIISAFDIARAIALGADWCNSARGFMFALGCIQAQSCHTGKCPTGITTQDPLRQKALVVTDKAERVKNFHHHTLDALKELLEATGVHSPSQISLRHIMRRTSATESRPLSELYPSIVPGSLIDARPLDLEAGGTIFERHWQRADPSAWGALK